jgi:hypothetical protein
VATPREDEPSKTSTAAFASALPDSEMTSESSTAPSAGDTIDGAAGAWVSIRTVRALEALERLPAASVAATV